ncbi:TPA: glycosyltransferase [Streptococcus suis]
MEGQPLSLSEACAYGLPILITPGTNVSKEVLDFNLGWVANQTKESISEKLNFIMHHSEEIQFYSKNAREYT